MYKDEIVPHMELLHIWVDCSSDLLDPILEAWLKWELSNDEWSHIWLILDWSIVEEHMSICMYELMFHHLWSDFSIYFICHDWGIGLCLRSYSGRSEHSCAGIIESICLLSSHLWLDCDCNGIFIWFLGCLYLFCVCLMVDAEVNVGIWYNYIILCILCWLELVRRVLWGLIFVDISSIPIHSCDLDVSNRIAAEVCEDKLIFFIAG